ncbi:MAG: protein disulfide oxidoreductase [Methylocaldum sp.]|uniref:protein disulfide oxidoreductase n=1 Tax=Methylocaldum sp. 14B TaxID=1912213 RepID=UPI000989F8E1|nr:protein disulfide oxidoreductase [Methylocaldum sp. 14B]MDV3240336.1 protein disulfide oxidoreductase [Methylocaldum sp.]
MANKLKQIVVFGSTAVVLYIGVQLIATRSLVSGMPPPIRATALDGTALDVPKPEGRPAVIYFWASWCQICKAMQSSIRSLARDTPLVSVALLSGDETEVREYVKREGFEFPVVLDQDGAIGRDYGIRGVPAVFILGPDGHIRFSTIGYTSELGLRLRLWLAGL